ncbi:platelet glycoprotein 4 [Hemicordylus capensis]|uniref:platelet glycoprotein 4 n=1 Tax=Hemicordylus capensis TaxID=884348 RepID=UPI00230354C0|nr:platelet glycoprotein 4 [Hemicordylus capensis]XP_053113887.1 platelet glycoprotein 4 [Hemicordylus capensis]XP_053113888.1 platelet glycoprotein 4 [Hemicordylus capensis]
MGCNQNCGLLSGAIIGAVLAIFGGALIPLGNYFIEKTVKKETVIENGTIAYENWVVPGSPVYRQFWFFNVENPEAVMENGSHPNLTQKGPYTYRVRYLPKTDIVENNDSTVSFYQPNIALFEPDMSVGPENDNITLVNLAVVAAPAMYQSGFIQSLLDMWVKSSKSKFLQTRSVKEILWGYEDPFLKKIPLPIEKKIGIFLPYNKTLDGLYTIYSGKNDTSQTALIQSYKKKRTLGYWEGYCDMVNGTDGASFPPFVKKDETLRFFSSDICRSIYGVFDSEQSLKDIPLYRFIVPPSAFASPLITPDNICFCTNELISKNCTLAGALDISACKEGKPVIITLPHFLYASEELFEGVKGMNPNLQEHMTYLDIEPTTGFTLQFAKRLQINLLVMPNSRITPLKPIKMPFAFPVLWLNETGTIDDQKAEFFRSKVTNKIKLLHLMEAVLIIVGAVMFLGFMVSFIICRAQKSK